MKKITKFLMTSVLLLTGAYGINNFNETKEVEAATFVEGDKLYLNAGGSGLWDQKDAWFAAHLFNSATNVYSNVKLEAVEGHDGYYSYTFDVEVAAKEVDTVVFLRMNPETTSLDDIWKDEEDEANGIVKLQWNKTENFAFEEGKDLFTITEWHVDGVDSKGSNGVWSKYIFNPTNIFQAVQTVENDETFNDAAKFVGALPKGTEAAKNSNEEYNVGFKFDFTYSYEEVSANILYLKPNSNWVIDNARFAVYTWDNSHSAVWYDMKDTNSDGYYELDLNTYEIYGMVIFCRMNPSTTANNWSNKWNQTGDITMSNYADKNLCTINDGQWDCGSNYTWSTKEYTNEDAKVDKTTKYSTKTGYYTCANLTSVRGFDSSVVPYEVEVYFAVVVTDIPSDYDGGTVSVTPAYQDLNGTTIYGSTAIYSITIGATGVVLANA